jgi:hypothetical protein
MDDPIETHEPSPTDLPELVRDQAELELLWRTLMQPLGWSRSSIWVLLVEADGHPVRQLTEIVDDGTVPDGDQLAGFCEWLASLTDELFPGARVAFLRSRPGRGGLVDDDRDWAERLYAAARRAAVPCEVVHVATDTEVVPVPLDEISVRRSA